MSTLRDQLLDAAVRVIEDEGAAAVTTRRIAEEAGCSEGSIYNHFGTKEDLLACAIGERIAGFPARIAELTRDAGQGDVSAQLREVAALALEFFSRRAALVMFPSRDPEVMRAHARRLHEAGRGPW